MSNRRVRGYSAPGAWFHRSRGQDEASLRKRRRPVATLLLATQGLDRNLLSHFCEAAVIVALGRMTGFKGDDRVQPPELDQ